MNSLAASIQAVRNPIINLKRLWKQSKPKIPTELPATVATWAIYGLASNYSHAKKRPILEKFVDEALPLVAVNLEMFA